MAKLRLFAALLAGSALAMGAARAQEAPTVEEGAGEIPGEIIVTATRRAESLQDVPASITAFNAETITAAGIERPGDFIGLTSNVNLIETQNAGNAFVIIRGISQNRNSEPSVAVVVDGVQQVNPAQFNQELVDVAQIEVLKGPQGGLYGRNAIGGAIIITSKAPTDELSGKLTAGIDNGFGYYLRGNLSGPLSDTLKFRVAGSWYDTNGFIPNTFLGEDADPVKDLNLRANLLWEPTPELTFDLRGSVGLLKTQAFYYNIVNDVNDTSLPVRVNNAGQNDRDLYNVALRVTHESDIGTFASVTSYDKVTEILTGDAFDFLPIPESFFFNLFESIFGPGNGFDLNQSQYLDVSAVSQELRYESPADGPLQVIAGGYAIGTKRYISTGNLIDTGQGVFPVFRVPSTNPINPQFSFLADDGDNFAWALFGNVIWKINDQLRFDGSLRYDRDRRDNTTLTPTAFLPNLPGFPPATTGEVRRRVFSAWQPKATLTWKPVDEVTLFGGWSRGFRSGGFNQTGVGAIAAGNGIVGVGDIFEAEVAETFEIGAKTQTSDRALTFNLAAYTTKSENSYFFVFLAANSTQNLGNVPEARLKGFEVDATWRAAPGLDFILGYGYTDSAIKRFANAALIDNNLPGVSRYTLNLSSQYKGDITDSVSLLARLDYRRTGRTWFDIENSTSRDPIDIVDARVGITSGGVTLTGFASNLFDERYNAEFSPGGFVFKGRPRRFGAEVSFAF
ncbi:TonB-dependent receptor [Polymorphobacter multimanifer]|uniref:Iron complex outermembrane receptor protein n=1 Tax=Polymorphobacter multimanifer TaxID=1070431 RepID=A0A841LCB6_9SPHN|nr:TonB-dependent receptor [Polymorphobacter multimanifer]MBB6226782.1 iron complex outermembrane receptor protein [Polymorphobacter multimanifer]